MMPAATVAADTAAAAAGFVWRWEWRPSSVAALVFVEIVYVALWTGRGFPTRPSRRKRLPVWRLVAFTIAIAMIIVAEMSPIGANDERFLSMHMLQHDIFMWVTAPGLLFGFLPLIPLGDDLPPIIRRPFVAVLDSRVAWIVSTVLLWAWHLPAAYDLALANDSVHALEHACFLAGYVLYWWPLVASPPELGALRTHPARIGYLAAGAVQSTLLAALIMFHDTVLYRHYAELGGLVHNSPFADQQLAGALMLFPGAAVYVVAAALTLHAKEA